MTINETDDGQDLHEGHDDHEGKELTNDSNGTRDGANETEIAFHDLDYLMEYEDLLREKGNYKRLPVVVACDVSISLPN